MTLKWHDRRPVSWLGYTDFLARDSRQGQVWAGRTPSGQRAFLKIHREVGSFHREYRAYTVLKNRGVGAQCLAVDEAACALLLSDAGKPVTQEQQATEGFATTLWDKVQRLQGAPIPTDTASTKMALEARWSRLSSSLTHHIESSLRDWVYRRIQLVGDHQRGWTHRDLRPENVVVDDGDARLIDLGQARPDFRIFDAVPFYAGDWSPTVSNVVLSQFETTLGTSVMMDLPLFSVLYFLGSVEQLVRRWHPDDDQRIQSRYRVIRDLTDAPLNFDDFFAQIT